MTLFPLFYGGRDMDKSTWAQTYQVAVVVRDIDEAIRHYESLGIGPFKEGPSGSSIERRVYGKPAPDAKVIGRVAQMGPIEFELLQPVSGRTIYHDFLESRGEGVIHICAYTDDLQRDMNDMADKGYREVSYLKLDDGGEAAHFDTGRVGGLLFELFQLGEKWK